MNTVNQSTKLAISIVGHGEILYISPTKIVQLSFRQYYLRGFLQLSAMGQPAQPLQHEPADAAPSRLHRLLRLIEPMMRHMHSANTAPTTIHCMVMSLITSR